MSLNTLQITNSSGIHSYKGTLERYCEEFQIRVCNKRGCCLYLMRVCGKEEAGLFLEIHSELARVSRYKLLQEMSQIDVK